MCGMCVDPACTVFFTLSLCLISNSFRSPYEYVSDLKVANNQSITNIRAHSLDSLFFYLYGRTMVLKDSSLIFIVKTAGVLLSTDKIRSSEKFYSISIYPLELVH